MTTLETLGISGIRGYNPDSFQKIKFLKPLTLISGQNGSGKTTIIQCLKFMTTGIFPPNCDKGKNFIMDTKIAGTPQVTGDLRMIFNVNNRPILIKRRMTLKSTEKGIRFESIEQSIRTKDISGNQSFINHQCAQIQKQVPRLLGITRAMLDNVVFCHQDDSLWPFADNNTLKQIFDELFQTKSYTKAMDQFWQIKRRKQIKLKQCHVRAQYERESYHRFIDKRQALFNQLEELAIKAKALNILRNEVKQLKSGVRDNADLVKQREKLFYKKGILEASILNTQQAIRKSKVQMIQLQHNYFSKKKGFDKASMTSKIQMPATNKIFGTNKMQIQDDQSKISFQSKKLPLYITEQRIQSVNIQVLSDVSAQLSTLQSKKQGLSLNVIKFKQAQDHLQNLKNYSQLSKRQKQISSQIDRIKDIMPQFRFIKNVTSDTQFVNIIHDKLEDLSKKKLEGEVLKQKYQRMILPNFYQSGFTSIQVQNFKTEMKQTQRDVSKTALIILKTVNIQLKQLPLNIDLSDSTLKKGQRFETQLRNLQAVISAKFKQLKQAENIPKKYKYRGKQGQQYLSGGLDMQKQMIHYCESHNSCFLCNRYMNEKQLSVVCQKMQQIKNKTINRIQQLKSIRTEKDPFDSVDPQPIINKIQQELVDYQNRKKVLVKEVDQYLILKKYKNTQEHNFILNKFMSNCNLNLGMLTKIIATTENDNNPDSYYQALPLQKFKEFCSSYMIKSQIYKNIKQKLKKIDLIKQQNQLIQKKRLQITNQKNEILVQIQSVEQETQNLDFLKNSYRKLESLIRIQSKGNQKSKATKTSSVESSSQNIQANGIKLNTIQQASAQVNRLHFTIIEQKYEIQRLEIAISFSNYYALNRSQKQSHIQISLQLQKFTASLNTAHALLDKYNLKKNLYDRQMQKFTSRMQQIKSELNQKPSIEYLRNIKRIKQLQDSIKGMEILHIQLQNAINYYQCTKMAQINTYIAQLWKQIYHGNDIRHIEILCIPDKQGARRKKKNFNYKIMMKKTNQKTNQQANIEMKGRCSMGQKVLASIVIRLAIAQVFCSSTRILALDEPTTNLDKQHMKNLANALIRLIQMSGSNLQLILISHDLDFINLLQQYAEEYYQISRDKKRHSKIHRKTLRQIYDDRNKY